MKFVEASLFSTDDVPTALPIVVGEIAGQKARFLLDTGAAICVLSPEFAAKLKERHGVFFF